MTAFSVHTSASQTVALNVLASIQTRYNAAQKQASTGYKVADAADNASVFAVAQGIRANLASYDTIQQSLNDGLSAVKTALTGATTISNLITSMTATLTSLASGTLTTAERATYSTQFVSEVNEIRYNIIPGSSYNGNNLLECNIGTVSNPFTGDYFTNFTPASPLILPAGLNGVQLTIANQNLFGGSAGTDGWLGLARVAFYVATDTHGVTSTVNDTVSTAFLGYGHGVERGLWDRTLISSQIALAALAPVSESTMAYITGTATVGVASVFGSALANFQNQVNAALGSLGADYTNIGNQITFVQSLNEASTDALGNLVDANLSKTSAQLTALATQQKLATEALSVINSQSKNLLSLFKAA
jgi:flagellin